MSRVCALSAVWNCDPLALRCERARPNSRQIGGSWLCFESKVRQSIGVQLKLTWINSPIIAESSNLVTSKMSLACSAVDAVGVSNIFVGSSRLDRFTPREGLCRLHCSLKSTILDSRWNFSTLRWDIKLVIQKSNKFIECLFVHEIICGCGWTRGRQRSSSIQINHLGVLPSF